MNRRQRRQWFSIAVGILDHLGLLEFFRMAQFKGIRLLLSTQWAAQGSLSEALGDAAVLPLSNAALCAWLLLQALTGKIADIAAMNGC